MQNEKGVSVVFEGINACGKRIAVKAIGAYLESIGKKGFDLVPYWKEYLDHPEPEILESYDYVLSAEPTHSWAGSAIRKEMFFLNGRKYPEQSMLNAYALDRHILYRRLIVPLRNAGKIILQERTLATTLVIQTTESPEISWEDVLNHHDHQYVLRNLADLMIVVDIEPERAAEFIRERTEEEDDNDQYEALELQKRFADVYRSKKFQNEFESRGCKVVYIKNDSDVETLKRRAVEVFKKETGL